MRNLKGVACRNSQHQKQTDTDSSLAAKDISHRATIGFASVNKLSLRHFNTIIKAI